eukprot:CAMPEP_0174283598 /NCGR_PEP_ID=MMETSP0809-20121228/4316_1 /TAXON_ID=73025 ORGANISM="Eutreptiella gymnastica-like, Strain CCMP1594" /NCGR_SAMPLE_ID=MMETSP0809 /ASSEMBLY_ACC=CAM_ASM_000658 /LENGTH=93 /DNA_ID=CAMNT_0015378633 /DNA_START=308 /DNA_END=586 /DNA_ORIENTATION=+
MLCWVPNHEKRLQATVTCSRPTTPQPTTLASSSSGAVFPWEAGGYNSKKVKRLLVQWDDEVSDKGAAIARCALVGVGNHVTTQRGQQKTAAEL